MSNKTLEPIQYTRGKLELLNQLLLPTTFVFEEMKSIEDTFIAIRDMKVRGAPAIAVSAALGVAVEAHKLLLKNPNISTEEASKFLIEKLEYLQTSRPTAVNLFNMVAEFKQFIQEQEKQNISGKEILQSIIERAEQLYENDAKDNANIGEHGSRFLEKLIPNKKLKILTHCNTGALATSKYGTALGVIRWLHKHSRLERAFATETRPYNQGARLTAFELVYENIPATLVVDSAVSYLMQSKGIDAVIVGADRICKNGDTANKIGTLQLAIAAKHFGIPFFVAAPSTSFDLNLSSGDLIKIEERSSHEVEYLHGTNIRNTVEGIQIWNPSFDVTPHHLITGLITEVGVIVPEDGKFNIEEFFKKNKV